MRPATSRRIALGAVAAETLRRQNRVDLSLVVDGCGAWRLRLPGRPERTRPDTRRHRDREADLHGSVREIRESRRPPARVPPREVRGRNRVPGRGTRAAIRPEAGARGQPRSPDRATQITSVRPSTSSRCAEAFRPNHSCRSAWRPRLNEWRAPGASRNRVYRATRSGVIAPLL